jgi:hypothetical protein
VIVFELASIVLEANVSAPAKVAIVPVVGKTKFVAAVVLKVISEAFKAVVPEVVKLAPVVIEPPSTIILSLSLPYPVPPFNGLIIPEI